MGTVGFFLGVKQPRREAERSPPSSAAVKNVSSYTSTSLLIPSLRGQGQLHLFYLYSLKISLSVELGSVTLS